MDFQFILRQDKKPKNEHALHFNLPDTNELAIIILNDAKEPADVQLRLKAGGALHEITDTNPSFDPLRYTLLFPFGQPGWTYTLRYFESDRKVTEKDYYNYIKRSSRLLHAYSKGYPTQRSDSRLPRNSPTIA